MDDPGWSWPAWKFGMKRDDLFTSLQDKYNTVTLPISDPEAFHHDVYEISSHADTAEDFHRLLAERQRQRLSELHESFESLAVEIVANPKLIASDQWQFALHLFRTKSFDALVRYFASYIPDECLDRRSTTSASSSFSEANSTYTTSTKASSVDDAPCTFLDVDFSHGPMTEEPCEIHHAVPDSTDGAPLSPPESQSTHSEVSSPDDAASPDSCANPPSRSMSFSGSESGVFGADLLRRRVIHDDETSQSDCDTAVASVSDCAESHSSLESLDDQPLHSEKSDYMEEDDFETAQYPEDAFDFPDDTFDTPELDTPTPRQVAATSYVDSTSVAVSRRLPSPCRSPSPKTHFLSHRCEAGAVRSVRRSPEEGLSKVQKPTMESCRKRPKARRRVDL